MSRLTREDLMEILTFDGTYTEMLGLMQNKELSKDECNNIVSLLLSDNEEEIKRNFEKVLEDIKKAPDYNIEMDDKRYWKEYREEIADDVKNLLVEVQRLEEAKEQAQKQIENIQNNEALSMNGVNEKIIAYAQQELSECIQQIKERNTRVAALTLMDAEAKSFQQQLLAAERQTRMQSERDLQHKAISNLKKAMGVIEHSFTVNRETNGIINRAYGATSHPFEDLGIKISLKRADYHLSEMKEAKQRSDNIEAELINRANKKIMKEYEKEHRFDKLKEFLGYAVSNNKPQGVINAKEAIEYLDKHDNIFGALRTSHLEKALQRNTEIYENEKKSLDTILEKVQNRMNNRRVEVRSVTETMLALDDQGLFSQNGSKAESFKNAVEEAKACTQLKEDAISPELTSYILRDEDRRNLISGQAIDWTVIHSNLDSVDMNKVLSPKGFINRFHSVSRGNILNEEKRQAKMAAVIKHIPNEYFKEKGFVEELIRTDWHAYNSLPEDIKNKENIALTAIDESFGAAYIDMDDKLKRNVDIAIAAFNEDPSLKDYMPKDVLKDKEFVKSTKNSPSKDDWLYDFGER